MNEINKENWQPSASIENLRKRAAIIAKIRNFFNTRNYLEVETPIMARFGISDPYLANIKARFRNQSYCLQTSPEYHMKRLLAAGSGAIYQLARVFRDDELGRWHNPEFTMLEWYQPGINHHQLIDEVDLLLQEVLVSAPLIKKTYQQAFLEICDFDPITASVDQLKQIVASYELGNVLPDIEEDRDQYLFLLMSHVIEPGLSKESSPVAIYNFPISQAALAQVNNGFAERFEIYYCGVELANGFHELTDPSLQRVRFEQDNAIRKAQGFEQCSIDEYLIEALEQGIPPCSGVALGLERLLALALNEPSISKVLAFDFIRA